MRNKKGRRKVQNNLESEVKKSGMSKTEFSEKVGISLMSFYRYAKGKRTPDIQTVQRIAQALDVTVNDLYPTQTQNESVPVTTPKTLTGNDDT